MGVRYAVLILCLALALSINAAQNPREEKSMRLVNSPNDEQFRDYKRPAQGVRPWKDNPPTETTPRPGIDRNNPGPQIVGILRELFSKWRRPI